MGSDYTLPYAGGVVYILFPTYMDDGTTNRLIAEVAVPAYTSNTTAAQAVIEISSLIGFAIPGAASNAPCIRATFNDIVQLIDLFDVMIDVNRPVLGPVRYRGPPPTG